MQIRPILRTAMGASSAAFRTRVLPAVMAMAILRAPSMTGAFHGMMPPTTPRGSRRLYTSMSSLMGTTSPFNSVATPPKYRKISAVVRASGRAWVRMALPVSQAMV